MTFKQNFLASFRVAASLAFGLAALEAVGFALAGASLYFIQFTHALLAGALAALAWALLMGLSGRFANVNPETAAKLTNLAAALFLLYLVAGWWFHRAYFRQADSLYPALTLLFLLAVFAAAGRMLWTYLDRGGPDLAAARFPAMGATAVVAAGVFSVLQQKPASPHLLAIFAIFVAAVFPAAMYAMIRLLWGRRRPRVRRLISAAQALALVAAPIAALAGAAFELSRDFKKGEGGRPPVILIVVDTLRADYVSAYSPQAPSTPHIDAVARDGILFEHPVAPSSWTATSVASILTGLYPSAVGVGTLPPQAEYGNYTGLLESPETIAEKLSDHGYRTCAILSNPWLTPFRNFDQGFQNFIEMASAGPHRPRFLFTRAIDLVRGLVAKERVIGDEQTRLVRKAIGRMDGGPFFLYAHYLEPHLPYMHHPKFPVEMEIRPLTVRMMDDYPPFFVQVEAHGFGDRDKEFFKRRYGQEVRYADQMVGEVMGELKARGIYDQSLVVIVSDHGEELWEHGGFEHGHSFYREIVEVPLIVKLPGNRHAGARVSSWVGVNRVAGTILDAVGVEAPFAGRSLLPLVDEPASIADEYWFSERVIFGSDQGAVGDSKGHKAIIHGDDSVSCFDLASDPDEKNPRSPAQCGWPQDSPGPLELFKKYQAENRKIFVQLETVEEGGEISKEDLDSLRHLGYIQ